MTPDEIERSDVSKLHSESNQLRNQQFLLGTLALGAVGYAQWLIPALSRGSTDSSSNGIATISLLVLLSILFTWSVALRRLIGIISQYLQVRKMSRWETEIWTFTLKKGTGFWSQTIFVMILYVVLGFVLAINFFLMVATTSVTLSSRWTWVVLLATAGYVVYVYVLASMCRGYDVRAGGEWRKILAPPEDRAGS